MAIDINKQIENLISAGKIDNEKLNYTPVAPEEEEVEEELIGQQSLPAEVVEQEYDDLEIPETSQPPEAPVSKYMNRPYMREFANKQKMMDTRNRRHDAKAQEKELKMEKARNFAKLEKDQTVLSEEYLELEADLEFADTDSDRELIQNEMNRIAVEKEAINKELNPEAIPVTEEEKEMIQTNQSLMSEQQKSESNAVKAQNLQTENDVKVIKAQNEEVSEQITYDQAVLDIKKEMEEEQAASNKLLDDEEAAKKDILKKGTTSWNDSWEKMSTGQKILAAIAIALGEMSKGIGGGTTNVGLKILQDAIEGDIEATKARLAENSEKYKKMSEAQKLGFESTIRERAVKRLSERLAIDGARLGNQGKKDYLTKKLPLELTQMQANIMKTKVDAAAVKVTSEAKKAKTINAEKYKKVDPYFTGDLKDSHARNIPGIGYANSKAGAKIIRALVPEHRKAMQAVRGLQEVILEAGHSFSPEQRTKARTNTRALLGALRLPYTGPGVFQLQEQMDLLKDAIGDVNSFTSWDSLSKIRLDNLEKVLGVVMESTLEVNGIQPKSKKPKSKLKTRGAAQ